MDIFKAWSDVFWVIKKGSYVCSDSRCWTDSMLASTSDEDDHRMDSGCSSKTPQFCSPDAAPITGQSNVGSFATINIYNQP